MCPSQDLRGPFVGPHPIQKGELLYGRDNEVSDLVDLLFSERIVLLHSPSGAGKSSLVNAGLIPALEDEYLHILPVIRVNKEMPDDLAGRDQLARLNCYVLSTILSLEPALPASAHPDPASLVDSSLDRYLTLHEEGLDSREAVVLIFDQFEEILTLDPIDLEAKHEFFRQLGEALRNRRRWALFVVREDYVGSLDPYLQPIPTQLSVRLRLDLLTKEAARQAIQRPRPAGAGEEMRMLTDNFSPEAAARLAEDLAQIRVQQPDGNRLVKSGPHVEPVQLQVVCERLWRQAQERGKSQVSVDALKEVGSVDEALAGYFAEKVVAIAAGRGVPEWRIRRWFDRQLITAQGIRGQVMRGVGHSEGLENEVIEDLIRAYLVRQEQRRGVTWYELAHDRLIEPLRRDSEAWYRAEEGTSITVRIHDWDRRTQTHRAEATLDDGRFFYGGELHLDQQALSSAEHDSQAYGRLLFDALLDGPMRTAYDAAIKRAAEQTRGRLRFRLWIDSETLDMHVLPWERLCHLEKGHPVPMSTSSMVSFSRYKGLPSAEPGPVSKRPIRVLIAISNPADPQAFRLPPIDVEQEMRHYDAALGALQKERLLQVTLMPGTSGLPSGLQTELAEKGYEIQQGATELHEVLRLLPDHHVFHFHGHGGLNQAGEGFLFLEGSDGQVKIATEDELMPRLAAIPLPRLVVLGGPNMSMSDDPKGKMVILAPKLIRAGVPAVITFHEQMTAGAARQLLEIFYRQLCERGTVDEPLNHARAGLRRQGSDDWAHPVLFTSLERAKILSTHLAPGGGVSLREEHRELVVRIRPRDPDQDLYPVEATLDDGGVFYGGGLSLSDLVNGLGGAPRLRDLVLGSEKPDLKPVQERLYQWFEVSPQDAGLWLFEVLFSGPTRRAYEKGVDRAATQTQGRLRFRLWIDDDAAELHALPWEVLYGIRGLLPVPLAASPLTPFSRYAALEVAELEPIARYPLHLLIAISSPTDLRGLDPEQLVTYLLPAFESARQKGLLRVTLMPGSIGFSPEYSSRLAADGYEILDSGTTLEALRELLPTCHIFQFFGPSKKHPDHGTEKLVFEDWEGRSHEVPEADLEDLWPSDTMSLPYLVVFSTVDTTVRLVTRLARRRGTAVVASQGRMPLDDLLPFARRFYLHLFEHGIVDRAVNQARLAIFDTNRPYWTFPVLLMGLPHGQLFHPPSPGEENES